MWDDGEGWSWVLVPPDGQGEPHQKKSLLKEGGGEGASEEDQPPQKRKKEEEKKDEKKDEKLALKLSRGKPAEETQRKPTGEAQKPAEEAQKEEEPPLSQGSSLSATTLPWE